MTTVLRKRNEIEEKYRWNLGSIYATDDHWRTDLQAIEEMLPKIAAYKGRLGESGDTLLAWFKDAEALTLKVGHMFVYANLMSDSDTTDQDAMGLRDQARGVFAKAMSAAAFAEPELLDIPQAQIEKFMEEVPDLAMYRHYLEVLRKREGHVRSPEVEQVMAMASDALETPRLVHTQLADADLQYGPVDTDDGPVDVTSGTLALLLRSPDIRVRKEAWERYADGFLGVKNAVASCVVGGIKRAVLNARVHNYPTVIEMALEQNHIPRSVYDNILETSKRKLPVWHRYWSVRRRALGLDMMHPYDIFAPLTDADPKVTYEESVDMVCEGMGPLGEEYCAPMRKGMLDGRWVDVYPNVGKRSGAYSAGFFGTDPFILMSHIEDLESMSTLAHEIGHSMHSYFSRKNQPQVYSRYGLFAAEVASNFNQAMVRAHLLQKNPDRDFQVAVLEEAMYNFHRYFFLMPILARWELDMHTRVEGGQALTADTMNKSLADLFREGYGPEVEIDEERVGITWAQFSTHLYSNYYVYQYATGISAANALANTVLTGGEAAAQNYMKFLKAGGSMYPLDALKLAGIDMSSPEPVEQAFNVLEGHIDRLEKLVL